MTAYNYGDYFAGTCFMCDSEMTAKTRRAITLRILGEAELVGICADCKYSVSSGDLWAKVEAIEAHFFLKRLANPFYGWEHYWQEYYDNQKDSTLAVRKVTKPRPPRWNE